MSSTAGAYGEALDEAGYLQDGIAHDSRLPIWLDSSSWAVYGSAGSVMICLVVPVPHASRAHHDDVLSGVGDHAEVMGDQARGDLALSSEFADQVEDGPGS